MFYRRQKNAILFTMAVLMLTDFMNVLFLFMIIFLMPVNVVMRMYLPLPDQQIDHKSGYGTNGCFRSQHTQYKADIHFLRNQDRQHLIRSGQINGYQCSQGDHPACI